MTEFDYDLFVIGAGSGGVRASRIAASHGARVAIAEEYRIGGTCVIRGCVPKKLLVYGAQFAHGLNDAPHYGWTLGAHEFSWPALRDTVLKDVDRLEAAYTTTLNNNGVSHFKERARLSGKNEVTLASGQKFTARIILIATGAWPVVPDFPGNDLCITSNEVFHLPELPKRIVIQGGGYIAMEFAGIFNALGSAVTVINRSDVVLRSYDESLQEKVVEATRARGITYAFNRTIAGVERDHNGALLVHTHEGDPIPADTVLVATGRRPNTAGLGLEDVGIKLGAHHEIIVDTAFQTSCPGIYAVGDVTGKVQLTPVAIREGHAFADNVFGGGDKVTVDYANIPSAVFSQPPIAAVGLTEAEARKSYANIKVYSSDFRPMTNTFASMVERALYKMIVDADSGRVIGLHMIGPDAPEILQAAAIAIKAGLTKADFDATFALHPSMAEELVLMR